MKLIVSDNTKTCLHCFKTGLVLSKFLNLLMNIQDARVPVLTEMIFEYRCLIM